MVGGMELPRTPTLLDEEGVSDLDTTLSPKPNHLLAEEIERLRGMVQDMF